MRSITVYFKEPSGVRDEVTFSGPNFETVKTASVAFCTSLPDNRREFVAAKASREQK